MLASDGVNASDKGAVRRYAEGKPEAAFYHNKILTAVHFAYRVLPNVTARAVSIRAGEAGPVEAVL